MCRHCPDFLCATVEQQFGCGADGAAGVDHVVGEDAQTTIDVTNDFFCDRNILRALGATLVDECNVSILVRQVLSESFCNFHAASIRRHDDEILFCMLTHVLLENRQCGEVINRAREKTLNLTAVQVDGDHA